MARVKLAEATAKRLLIDDYKGVVLFVDTLHQDADKLNPALRYVVKVDQGIKKRGKQGLIRFNLAADEVPEAVMELSKKGFTRFIAEPMFSHDDSEEQYVSFERATNGVVISYLSSGGVEVEDYSEAIKTYNDPKDVPLPTAFLEDVITKMNQEHFSFIEINPLVVREEECAILDAAVLADSAGEVYAHWTKDDVVEFREQTAAETAIAQLNENSTAALSFRVLNPNGALWVLLSGGGASITIADEAHNQGKASLIGNYGEYSGGPTAEETYLYTKQVLQQMAQSKAPRKALIIAGGVANFTDVKKTFSGIIMALEEIKEELSRQAVKVFVRRGGPNETEGLAQMKHFLEQHKLFGSVHGSDAVLTQVIDEVLEYIDA